MVNSERSKTKRDTMQCISGIQVATLQGLILKMSHALHVSIMDSLCWVPSLL
ncbi:unnamed protein product [Brassica napus]|uniref:(rape) hypothetical protein n=1 Tax=Brassica napus TaxID=3708 RepID=A0A816U4B6_BRANA|nr:unnamed protein product [Brassica napus]